MYAYLHEVHYRCGLKILASSLPRPSHPPTPRVSLSPQNLAVTATVRAKRRRRRRRRRCGFLALEKEKDRHTAEEEAASPRRGSRGGRGWRQRHLGRGRG